jgi:hypothetical protein
MDDFLTIYGPFIYNVGLCAFAALIGADLIGAVAIFRKLLNQDEKLAQLRAEAPRCGECPLFKKEVGRG